MNNPVSLKRPGKEGGGMGIKRNLMIIQITIILRSAILLNEYSSESQKAW